MSFNQWLGIAGAVALGILGTAGAAAQTNEDSAAVSPTVLRESLLAENAKLTERLSLVESRRKAIIKASASLGFLAEPVRRLVSNVGPYEEQLHQRQIDNLVLLAKIRRATGARDVEQLVKQKSAKRGDAAVAYRLGRLF